MQIEEKPPFDTPFEWMGGEEPVRRLVDRFYDLMDLEPGYKELRAAHGSTLEDARQKLFWFLCGWLGGPDYYVERFGHPRLRMRHMPFSIGIQERGWRAWIRPCWKPKCPRHCAHVCTTASCRPRTGCATAACKQRLLPAVGDASRAG